MLTIELMRDAVLQADLSGIARTDCHPDLVANRFLALARDGLARVTKIGTSLSGDWPLYGVEVGEATLPAIVLTAGAHGEEHEGVLALLHLIEGYARGGAIRKALEGFRIVAVPQANPNGFIRNQAWMQNPSCSNYLARRWRDSPREDVEHSIPPSGEVYRRPEAQAIVKFYSMVAPNPSLYVTMHSNDGNAMGSFLGVVGDCEGALAHACDLVRAFAPEIGVQLRNDDPRGAFGYQRISHGVYGMPSIMDMQCQRPDAFVNTAQWALGALGARIAMISETQVLQAAYLTDVVVPDKMAHEFVAPWVEALRKAAEDRGALLARFQSGDTQGLVADPVRLAYEMARHQGHWSRLAEVVRDELKTYQITPATKRHQRDLEAMEHELGFELAATATNILQDGSERDLWQARLDAAYAELERIKGYSMVPLEKVIRFQLLNILAGVQAARCLK